ncbi:hypothetical protein [Kitasatospora sp. NPDC059827]|uniref:hypothetical protein n=1 Tax=Kitasatospora sp. NPDC059827 TaxID=3346964 RepID=UPI00364E19AA
MALDDAVETHAAEHPRELDAIHGRWMTRRHRGGADDDEWYSGACANGESEFDGTVRFEHDGCERFARSGRWSVPSDF